MKCSQPLEANVHRPPRRGPDHSRVVALARHTGRAVARLLLTAWLGLGWPFHTSVAAPSEIHLTWTNTPGDVSWISQSLTPAAPFVHYEFQVQYSANLSAWENAALIPGGFLGSAAVSRTFHIPATNAQGFVRLSYRLNMPGANLSGLDLSGADLRGANLAGANLSGTRLDGASLNGADLTGANLAGATLGGATLGGANLQDVNLNGFDLTGLDLSTILGTPLLNQVTANPAGAAAQLVPNLPYNSDGRDLVANDPVIPGTVSTRNAMLMLKTNATVSQLNALLAARGASIVASRRADSTLPNAMLMARFPTTSAQALFDLTVTLSADPIVAAAAPDVALGTAVITDDSSTASGWTWDIFGLAAGGNWGLEKARVPTCIIDDQFFDHTDLVFASKVIAPPSLSGTLQPSDHGNHVAGIVGATFENRAGIEGVNPLASLIGYERQGSSSYALILDIRNAIQRAPQPRVINLSLAYHWTEWTNASRPTVTSQFTAEQLSYMESLAQQYGQPMAGVANSAGSVLMVCAAGNDGTLVPARLGSPMNTAALDYGAANILVVEAHDESGNPCAFSNRGGQVAAPGTNILSTSFPNTFDYKAGTSMAAPFVSGVAGFLLAAAPTLTPAELITLIRKSQPNVDAFLSLMEIDQLPSRRTAHDREVLKMILDVDDGSLDGSQRVEVEGARLGRDRAFELVTGPVFDNTNSANGDGKITMSDFRRWRDWLLFTEGNHKLNGSLNHLKLDGNEDGTAQQFEDALLYPRGDFNGDGVLDRHTKRYVGGWFQFVQVTDLEALILSDLWEDPCFTNVFALTGLIDSVDFNVSAGNFYFKRADISVPVKVSAYDKATGQPLDGGGICLSPGEPIGVLTVPIGGPYFLASEPIPLGNGTNVQMRSIGELQVLMPQRGADYAVDLTLREMTAAASTANPVGYDIDSQPNTNQVDAYLGAQPEDPPPQETVGARAHGNEEATLYSIARAGHLPVPPPNPGTNTTFASSVRWQRSFIKDATQQNPRFLLKTFDLELFGSGAGTNELRAFAEIIMEIRAYDRSPDWQPIFTNRVEVAGKGASGGQSASFQLIHEDGFFPHKPLEPIGDQGAKYEQKGQRTPIDLGNIADGDSFELRYQLNTWVMGSTFGDSGVLASLGDPVQFDSGLRMNYGSFGDLPLIKRVSPSAPAPGEGIFQAASQSPVLIEYLSKTNFYYRLYRGTDADTTGQPFAMKLGIAGDDSMIDPAPLLPNPTEDDYTLENQPIDQPLDFDGDGIDDVYELQHPGILNPLDPTDAFQDPDGDGRSNLEEYQQGTDPETPDSPPPSPLLNFPGLVVPSYTGGELIDLNNDGLLDSAGDGLSVALAHLGGIFGAPITSPRPGMRILSGTAYVKLDGDPYPDAVLIDSLTNRLFVFRGVGDGTFTPLASYPAISGPSQIVLGNLNGDSLTDVALLSRNARGASLHVNNGDGTLTQIATLTTNAFGVASCLALADFNGDSRDDVVVGYSANVVVFLSQPGGGYGPAQPYPVGSSPVAIAVGDLNRDGRLDIVVANGASGDLSVLLGTTGGAFLPQVRYPVGASLSQLRLADLNGDTFLDAVVSRNSTDYQSVLPGLGNGTFGPLYIVPTGPSLSAIHDWNGDGKLDLISTLSSGGGMVNFGNGDGTFDTRLQIVPTNTLPTSVTAVDLNGDNKLELVGLNAQLNSIDVWEHAAVTGTNRLLASLVVGPWVTSYATGDFNGDGRIDIAVTTQTNSFNPRGSNQVVILTNAGNFTFQDAGHYPLAVRPNSIVSADFNGDGALDLAVQTGGGTLNGGSQLVSLRGNGAGGFQAGPPVVVGNTISFMAPANADADARNELVVQGGRLIGSAFVEFLEVFALDANGGWTNRQSLAFTNEIVSLQVVSMNGDAYPDLVVLQSPAFAGVNSLRMYPGGPTGFGPEQILADGLDLFAFSQLADLNGDGLIDMAAFNSLYLAKPGGGFQPVQNIYVGPSGVQGVADFNRDGKADLLSGLSILLQK